MTGAAPFWDIREGDCLRLLGEIPVDSVQCCVTSPPYFWARDYGVDGQLGHEPTVDAYVEALVGVLREVRRTLRPSGVVFLNLGDSYYSGNGQPTGSDPRSPSRDFMRQKVRPLDVSGWSIPKKSLIGIPWRVALAAQADGWTLRSAIIWNRVNAFTEPTATDRPRRQYEHVFLLAKSRRYDFDRAGLGGEEDVWNIRADRARPGHPAPFPFELAERCVLAGSDVGSVVLDPFCGAATTGLAALRHGRSFIGLELNAEFCELGRRRLRDDAPLLNTETEIGAAA